MEMAINLNAIEEAAKASKEIISDEKQGVELQNQVVKSEDDSKIVKAGKFIDTLANASTSLTNSISTVLDKINEKKRIEYDLAKLESDRLEREQKLQKELAQIIEEGRQKEIDKKHDHEERMYELKTKRMTVMKLIETVNEKCDNLLEVFLKLKIEGSITRNEYSDLSQAMTVFLSQLNNVPQILTTNNLNLITKDDGK